MMRLPCTSGGSLLPGSGRLSVSRRITQNCAMAGRVSAVRAQARTNSGALRARVSKDSRAAIGRRAGRIRLLPAVLLALSAGLGVAAAAYGFLRWITPVDASKTAAEIDVTRVALTVVAGVGGVVALVIAYRRQRDLEQSRFVERFGAAAAQLGATDVAVRIAGVYAMAGVADESDGPRRQQCIDVLCGYLRLPYTPALGGNHQTKDILKYPAAQDGPEKEQHFEYRQNDREVRATIVRVIADHLRPNAEYSWSESNFDFRTAHFEDVDLSNTTFSRDARFNEATFSGDARFNEVSFAGDVWFSRASFAGAAWFSEATFSRDARFDSAGFSGGAGFDKASFVGETWFSETSFADAAWFSEANFSGDARFNEATFSGDARFNEANFSGDARFNEATFSGDARFNEAKFSGDARFSGVTFSGSAGFSGARFSDTAWYSEARFSGTAWFSEATFSRNARFDSAGFSRAAGFNKASFAGAAWFNKASFAGDTLFSEASFARDAGFSGASFSGDVGFSEARFFGTAWFSEATFSRDARFDSASFAGEAKFGAVAFSNVASFSGVNFGAQEITFAGPKQWGPPAPVFDWDQDVSRKPANVEPQNWPPVAASS